MGAMGMDGELVVIERRSATDFEHSGYIAWSTCVEEMYNAAQKRNNSLMSQQQFEGETLASIAELFKVP